jgi:DNA-binding FadR family transcriptional regulator
MSRDAQGLSIQEKRPQIERAMKSQKKLIDLIEQGKAAEAEEHWRKHMEISHSNWIQGYETLTIQKLMAERNLP